MDRHHLLEIILWPNEYGTFRTILNSRKRLKELGIYDDFKMTIKIPAEVHSRMHRKAEIDAGIVPQPPDNTGKHWNLSENTKKKQSSAMKGNTNSKDMKWFNNGTHNTRALTCPDGYVPGRLKLLNNL